MPQYNTTCQTCHTQSVASLTFEQYRSVKSHTTLLDCPCGGRCTIDCKPQTLHFGLKEGPSGGWASKSLKENRYRRDRYDVMGRRQRDHVKVDSLVPNYQGQEAHTWRDVQDHVRSEKGEAAASTYTPLVQKEAA